MRGSVSRLSKPLQSLLYVIAESHSHRGIRHHWSPVQLSYTKYNILALLAGDNVTHRQQSGVSYLRPALAPGYTLAALMGLWKCKRSAKRALSDGR